MKSFICKVEEFKTKIIGFDMDGTLYDEFDFVSQAYHNVAKRLSEQICVDERIAYRDLCNEWLKYGSSANIFQKTADIYSKEFTGSFIKELVKEYRNAGFTLTLPHRTEFILDYLNSEGYRLFLITDGNSELQRRKIKSLGLSKWFDNDNIAISGDYGSQFQKPSPLLSRKIKILEKNQEGVLYVGDRDVDLNFSISCRFDFIKVSNMLINE